MEKPIIDKINQILINNEERQFLDLSVSETLKDAERVLRTTGYQFKIAFIDSIIAGLTVSQIIAIKYFYEMNTGRKAEDIV